ncbi:MAG TPA: BON domain-containing protein [Terriglobia bacterium]|nr:BON domain-containing protein [Terriglobia bacterium]
MRNVFKKSLSTVLVLLGLAIVVPQGVWAGTNDQNKSNGTRVWVPGEERIQKDVLHQLRMLPYYSVFDNLSFRINGNEVELNGQVVRPVLKSDAEHAVQRVEGVRRVINNIEVLPTSNFDDRIRLAEYRAIYRRVGLDRYGFQANPSIHIIVKNGNVTLMGVVANNMDRNIAGVTANTVPGVFSVTNDLKVEG